jgi:hypothetical protein
VAPGHSQATPPGTSPGFSFQPSYSLSSPCTTSASADRRRYPSLAHVAQHSMPRGFQPRPHDLFSSYKSRTCCPAPHGPGCAFAEDRALPTRRVGEAAIKPERRAAKQNERPLQQAQIVVRLPGAAATPAHTYTHATPARQSWMSARRHKQSPPLSEMAFPLVCRSLYPGVFVPNNQRVTFHHNKEGL